MDDPFGDDFLARRQRRMSERAARGDIDDDEDEPFNLEDYNVYIPITHY